MLILAKLIGLMIVMAGGIFCIWPAKVEKMIAFFREGKRIYAGGALRILLGIILLLAAPGSRLFQVVVIFGVLFVAAGLSVFILKPEKIKGVLEWWGGKSYVFYRVWAFVAVLIGGLLFYSV